VAARLLAKDPQRHDGGLAYTSALDHISDEIERVNLLIRLQLLNQIGRQLGDPFEQLKGLVISDNEVTSLLSGSPASEQRATDRPELMDALRKLDGHIEQRRAASGECSVFLTLPRVARLFQLSRFEEKCLAICLAPELDRKYDKLYAYLHDDVTRKRPSVDLVLSLLCSSSHERVEARAIFSPHAPLIKYRLIQIIEHPSESPVPLLDRPIKLDDRIVDLLLGYRDIDGRLESVARLIDCTEQGELTGRFEAAERLHEFVRAFVAEERSDHRGIVVHVYGPYGAGKRTMARVAAGALGLPLLCCDAERLLGGTLPVEDTFWLLAREALLQPAVLCLENFDLLIADGERPGRFKFLLDAIQTLSRVTVLCGSRPWCPQGAVSHCVFTELELPTPRDAQRAAIWHDQFSKYPLIAPIDVGSLGSKFRFTPGQIRDALAAAQDLATWRKPTDARITEQDLYAACRAQSNLQLARLARKTDSRDRWDDIVLPGDQLDQLHEICRQARNRHIVFGQWGFDQKLSHGKGLSVLFSGPPGTGKTMAAGVIAGELGLDLYRIDLSQVVSKYIGETEKNLDRIFSAAEHGNAILFFDEADALFGKRSEVRDSHDRYANVEISYLLQKMEEYEGMSILATNLRQHMDEAFMRRLQAVVEFPFPDEEFRERIWRKLFPSEAPLGTDVDFRLLAREIRLAGGSIKNIGVNAAFQASDNGGVIQMSHLWQAARREYQKQGRTWNAATAVAQGGAKA
jgi:AAA+ superfamily predicted ATPase